MDSPAGRVPSTLAPSLRVMLGKTSDEEAVAIAVAVAAVVAVAVAVAVAVVVVVVVAVVTEGTNTLFKADIALCLRGSDGPCFTRFFIGISETIRKKKKKINKCKKRRCCQMG